MIKLLSAELMQTLVITITLILATKYKTPLENNTKFQNIKCPIFFPLHHIHHHFHAYTL